MKKPSKHLQPHHKPFPADVDPRTELLQEHSPRTRAIRRADSGAACTHVMCLKVFLLVLHKNLFSRPASMFYISVLIPKCITSYSFAFVYFAKQAV